MRKVEHSNAFVRGAVRFALAGAGFTLPVQAIFAQDAASGQELEEVVVTGFRGSLNTALAQKRAETASIDVIASEDIGKFPDSNLAESMQRIPSVALSRGDGGEGKNISVRGLGPTFTRVRINGMEGSSQTGSSDIYGAGNNGRSFDFNVFPTEIFSNLAVRKTSSADVEEGSLGATVDLRAPRPFDYNDDRVVTLTARGIYNSVSEDVDPRASLLFSQKFADGTFGILASAAFQQRHTREAGYSAVDILSANTNANNIGTAAAPIFLPYCTPQGWTTTGPSPAIGVRGSTAQNCSQSLYGGVNPRTSTLEAFNAVYNLVDPKRHDAAGNLIPGSGAFFPRLPRYVNSEQDTERAGGTLSLQWAPGENTKVSLDGLFSRYQVERRDNYIAGISTGRGIANNGQPMVSIKQVTFDDKGSVQTATFDGMDVRSEGLVDDYVATFEQANLELEHSFSDSFKITATAGRSISVWGGPKRLQTFIDAIDVDNFTLDFSGGRETPRIGFGFDVSNPANFLYAPTPDTNQTVVGGYSFQGKPSRNVTANTLFELASDWKVSEAFSLKGGLQWRENNFKSKVSSISGTQTVTRTLPGTSLADYTTTIKGVDDIFGSGAPSSWVAMDPKKWAAAFGYPYTFNFCGVECGANQSQVLEEITSAYAMGSFNLDWGIPIRGDLGVRYVNTRQSAFGHIAIARIPADPIFPNVGFRQDVDQEYHDLLPSLNMVFEFTPDLLLRFAAAKVVARADLSVLAPSVSVTATTQNASVNNPLLDPVRAKTADLALEWYFAEGSLLSAAVFYKDIETYIQRITADEPFRNLGVPDSVLIGSPSLPTQDFHVSRYQNTDGGPLKGVELNAQVQFRNLPGFWRNTGFLANYTHVESEITYITGTEPVPGGTPGQVRNLFAINDLVNLSPNTASGTLFYDDQTWSVRATASYRDAYIREVPASLGSDVRANKANMFVDFSSSWNVSDNLTLIFEAQNLTDERNTLYIDSRRMDTLFQTEIGRTYNVGATFKF